MADLFEPPPNSAPMQRRGAVLSKNGKPLGRPPGARNRRSQDLGRYIEATFGGMTPGQQSAQLALVTPKDLRRAKADAKDLSIVDTGMDLLQLAMVVKATRLARALGCDRFDAYTMMAGERVKLMEYVHQKQPAAKPKDAGQVPTVFLIPEGEASNTPLLQLDDGDEETIEILEDFSGDDDKVSPPRSHGDT